MTLEALRANTNGSHKCSQALFHRSPLPRSWDCPPPPGTNYIETLRVQVHANCRIRRIYFSDRLYSEEELPPEFKLFLPLQK